MEALTMNKPKNDYEALVLGLKLALSAKTRDKAQKCAKIADQIALNLSPGEVERAKKEALQNQTI